ncbi:MAG: Fe-S cluster assembly protein SufD [Candidatus Latescibacterota bacterium]|nr:Fe-S cluster assembly protein SufD [Candidatus Latescibacterota bacterium]
MDDRELLEFYRAARAQLPAGTEPLSEEREFGHKHIADTGFPTRHHEAWRHTNPAPLTGTGFGPVSTPGKVSLEQISPHTLTVDNGPRLVFVDGRFAADLSRMPEMSGLLVGALSDATVAGHPVIRDQLRRRVALGGDGFCGLNAAFVVDGAAVIVDEAVAVDEVIEVLHLTTGSSDPSLTAPRTLITASAGSRLNVVESFTSLSVAPSLTSSLLDVVVGDGAQVEVTRIQAETDTAYHVGNVRVREAEGSRFTAHSLCLGGRIVRNDVVTTLEGEDIDSTLNGLSLTLAEEHVDNYTTIEHAAANCTSHELYKGILADASRTVFRGKIHVHREAQKTDAYQSNQSLLLSDSAEVTSKPQLEIYADDVKCSHGSTTGQLDANAIFYLRSRGVPFEAARRVLTRAFAWELIDRIPESVRHHAEKLVSAKLDRVLAGTATS